MRARPRVAAAPISWGVSELPGWGYQMPRERVLGEVSQLGFEATEAGPPGYLPQGPDARSDLLRRHGLSLAGGFVATVLHDPETGGLTQVEVEARRLAASGADVIVLAAAMPAGDYDGREKLSEEGWLRMGKALAAADRIAARHGLTMAFHPHVGTAVQSAQDVDRLLSDTRANLCLDTGHLFLGGWDPVHLVASSGDRIKHVHLKDVNRRVASAFRAGELSYADAVRRGLYTALGAGDLDIEGVVDRMLRISYSGWFVLEQDMSLTTEPEPNSGPIVSARESLACFRQIARTRRDSTGIST
jgi:inosose dehydratase